MNSNDVVTLFFTDLKHYNPNSWQNVKKADLSNLDATSYKAFSSVVTRYFIFRERHPEISDSDMRKLYYRLRIDMIARYFSEYPAVSAEYLEPFQSEVLAYINSRKSSQTVSSEVN